MLDPSPLAIWERFMRYHRTTTTAMDRQLKQTFGYNLDDYDVLHQLSLHREPVRMGDLADRLLVANSSCHRIVGRLVDAGLVDRSHAEFDRRVVLVALTAAGNRLRRRMATVHARDIDSRFSSHLTDQNAVELDAILKRLLAAQTEIDQNADSG